VDVAIQTDGKIVMVGKRTGGDFALVRFLGDSAPSLVTTAAIGTMVRNPTQPIALVPAPSPDPLLIAPVVDQARNDVDLLHLTQRSKGPTFA
jgi:hypothetical protein